ncbi:MAG: hypothetical protein ACJ8AP_03090 [Gemmatimonadales bacterium]
MDAFFELPGLRVAVDFLGIDQDFLLWATFLAWRESALREAADLPSRWRRLVVALLRFREGRPGFRFPWPTA